MRVRSAVCESKAGGKQGAAGAPREARRGQALPVFAAVAAVLNMVVITIMGAVVAVIYNLIARIVGGVKVGFESD